MFSNQPIEFARPCTMVPQRVCKVQGVRVYRLILQYDGFDDLLINGKLLNDALHQCGFGFALDLVAVKTGETYLNEAGEAAPVVHFFMVIESEQAAPISHVELLDWGGATPCRELLQGPSKVIWHRDAARFNPACN